MRFCRKAVASQLPQLVDLSPALDGRRQSRQSKQLATHFMQWWSNPSILHKLASAHRTALPLVKACGAGKSVPVRILDATGGWGVDAATLVAAGATVDIIERNPIMAQLLLDILQHAHGSSELRPLLRGRVGGLWGGDAAAALHSSSATAAPKQHMEHLWPPPSSGSSSAPPLPCGPWDVVYIDAMFPPRGKASAAVKLPAQWLHALAAQEAVEGLGTANPRYAELQGALMGGSLADMGAVLGRAMGALVESSASISGEELPPADALALPLVQAALSSPVRRIVVKRPGRAGPLVLPAGEADDGKRPSFAVNGKAVRFDVYQRPWLQHSES